MKLIISFITVLMCMPAHADSDFLLWYHDGGKTINHKDLSVTIDNVLKEMPAGDIKGMRELIGETLAIETRCGMHSYTAAAENWRNYGIAQIRADTAHWLMDMLYRRDKARFSAVYQWYDPEVPMEANLLGNIPFSIAICAELYAWRLKGRPIENVTQRAIAWKKYYNTSKGIGTIEGYLARSKEITCI